MQLVAYGAQDIYLTGNPQITFFKVVYRRHTNFAMEAIEQVFTGNVELGKKTSCTIARNGDLVGRMYLEVDLAYDHSGVTKTDESKFWKTEGCEKVPCSVPGHAMINYVEVEIGGQAIDKHYGEWLNIWMQLTETGEGEQKHLRLVNGSLQSGKPSAPCSNKTCDVRKLYIPLQFWFNRNPGLALPLIALQYHEVKLNLMLNKGKDVVNNSKQSVKLENICLFCDYIFLDTDERRRFAQVSHEYLIEQVQFNGRNNMSGNIQNLELRFNHPCKEIVWVGHDRDERTKADGSGTGAGTSKQKVNRPFNFNGAGGADLVNKAVLQLNGHDRFREREGTYFRTVQQYQHHTGGINSLTRCHASGGNGLNNGIYLYSFAINPEEHQPSGTCNFSRIDNAVLTLETLEGCGSNAAHCDEIRVYATNYNVLRIMSGMGGLAYSN
jgi:hypothetical protein